MNYQEWWAKKQQQLEAAEKQGVCSDCGRKLERPLNPVRPDVCGSCDCGYRRLSQVGRAA